MTVRVADPEEYGLLAAIEAAADTRFESVGMGPFSPSADVPHLSAAAVVLVSGSPPVGFACIDIVDGDAHLWQLSVHPSAGRQGIGGALVHAACEWARSAGYGAVTLTTYRDVPWNGPFYARLGFVPLGDLTPGLAAIREHERAIGDDDFGPRVAMRRAVVAGP